jgi:hypothetical protein
MLQDCPKEHALFGQFYAAALEEGFDLSSSTRVARELQVNDPNDLSFLSVNERVITPLTRIWTRRVLSPTKCDAVTTRPDSEFKPL